MLCCSFSVGIIIEMDKVFRSVNVVEFRKQGKGKIAVFCLLKRLPEHLRCPPGNILEKSGVILFPVFKAGRKPDQIIPTIRCWAENQIMAFELLKAVLDDDRIDLGAVRSDKQYLIGTLPMKRSSKLVINKSTAEEKSVKAINPQITPLHRSIGIRDSFISSIFCCRLDNMAARFVINASLAKSEGWNT